ncbi:MAG TPA: serine protease, partial [Polyangiaceae bacterium]|nr:serine protease [Polyangiaceae bacterium]
MEKLARGCVLSLLAWGALPSCAPDVASSGWDLGSTHAEFVNGADDRREYFEVTEPAERAVFEQSLVALAPQANALELSQGNEKALSTWGDINQLCEGERFGDQPSASFCSGVLVDWDLVLTSGHCVNVVPVSAMRVVFNYYYREPGELALSGDDVYQVKAVVAARTDRDPEAPRLDFGWLRLTEPVREPHRPARLRTVSPAAALGDPIISVTAGGGAPLKLDAGGQVLDVRADTNDYFIADTDTSEGSSGGAAFSEDLALLGTLARGAPDFVRTDAGCWTTDVATSPLEAREQFT